MFNAGKVMSSFNNVQIGMIASILKQAIPSISHAINTPGLLDGLSKVMAAGGTPAPPGVVRQIAESLVAAPRNGLGGGQLDQLPAALTKTMFISVLLEAVEDARAKPHFNVETAINDLWVKLSKVRPVQNQAMNQTLQQVTNLLKQMHDVQKSIIQNLR